MADGRSDDYPEEISQAGGTAGIHRLTLCKMEKFSDGIPAGKNVQPDPCATTPQTIKASRMNADMLFLPEKGFWKQHHTKAASAVLTIGIMTDIRQRRVRKNPVSMV
jgi:hypothetical protein